jgi:solute carrier family 31 (copper transporter), member 1
MSGRFDDANAGNRMLAVMTMNVGYFMSVLAGYFVGEVAVGRYSAIDDH